jgi:hypothetical protein
MRRVMGPRHLRRDINRIDEGEIDDLQHIVVRRYGRLEHGEPQ